MGLSTGIGIGIQFSRGGSQSWESYWASQPEVLFFGLYSEISGGQMPNKVTGSSDYLTVAGSAGSETYQAPNTASYQSADTDYIWFKTDTAQRTTTTAELIGYDFTRTIVKYANDAPYTIEAIMILSANVDTARMRDDFDLSVWWDNTLSAHGNLKGNRGAGQNAWTAEAVYDDRSVTLFAQMAALSETPTDERKTAIDTAIKALKAASLFETQFDALVVTRAHGNDSGLLNWITNATNGLAVLAPTFQTDIGYNSDGAASYINTQFNPYAQNAAGGLYLTNDACIIKKVSGTITAGKYSGARNTAGTAVAYIGTGEYQAINDLGQDTDIAAVTGYTAVVRPDATHLTYMRNALSTTFDRNATAPPNFNAFMMALNTEGAPELYAGSGEVYELYAFGKAISQANFLVFQGIMNTFFASL